jgi:hypothetical protein
MQSSDQHGVLDQVCFQLSVKKQQLKIPNSAISIASLMTVSFAGILLSITPIDPLF